MTANQSSFSLTTIFPNYSHTNKSQPLKVWLQFLESRPTSRIKCQSMLIFPKYSNANKIPPSKVRLRSVKVRFGIFVLLISCSKVFLIPSNLSSLPKPVQPTKIKNLLTSSHEKFAQKQTHK